MFVIANERPTPMTMVPADRSDSLEGVEWQRIAVSSAARRSEIAKDHGN
jgi:hypothetical protein